MLIDTNIQKVCGAYHVEILRVVLSPAEYQALQENGSPVVDLGGSFTGTAHVNGTDTAVNFTLPSRPIRLPYDLPRKQVFEVAPSDAMALFWRDTIVARLTAARDSLLTVVPSIEGENMITV